MAVLQLHEFTDRQRKACSECEEQLRALSGGAGTVRLDGPPGTGKTFVACHLLLKQLEEPGEIVFVCRKRALALFVARWLCVRRVSSSREEWSAKLRSMRFVFEARDGRPCAHVLSLGPGRIDAAVDVAWPLPAASLVIVDEAHHLYAAPQWEQWKPILASMPAAPFLLLSDDSQAHARAAYPSELPDPVRLTEVVRCTPRISLGCSDFALQRNQDGISCAHARPGLPLEARFFAAGAKATYATEIAAAVKQLAERFPGDGLLDDRVAILVPDAAFAAGTKALLEAALVAQFTPAQSAAAPAGSATPPRCLRRFSLIDAEEAAATLFSAVRGGSERLVFSSIDEFDGLERLFVIVAGMDAAGDGVPLARSRLYRGISRAHMHVTLVEEEKAGGLTEWLRGLRLAGEFDHEEEKARRKVGAAAEACEAATAAAAAAAAPRGVEEEAERTVAPAAAESDAAGSDAVEIKAQSANMLRQTLWRTHGSTAGVATDGEVWSPLSTDSGIDRLANLVGIAQTGLKLVDTVLKLGEGAGVPCIPAVCSAARGVLRAVQASRTVISDVLSAAWRTIDVLELLQLMAQNYERMDVTSRASVEDRIRELRRLLEDVRSAVAAFGKKGWLRHALKAGRRSTLSQLDSEITAQLGLLLNFYNLARDAAILARLQAREYAVEAEVQRRVAERKVMGEAVDEEALLKDCEVVRGIAVASGVSDAEFQEELSELSSEMRDGFASTGVKLDEMMAALGKPVSPEIQSVTPDP